MTEQLWQTWTEQWWRNWLAYHSVLPIVAVLAVAGLLWWRHRRGRYGAAEAGMVCGTIPWLYLAMLPDPDGPGGVMLVPLRDLVALTPDPADLLTQVVGNLLVFAALGFFLPVRFASFASVPRVLLVGAAGSIVIEVTQYAAHIGRVASVDDVLVNALGAGLAAIASRRWWQVPGSPGDQDTAGSEPKWAPAG